ncbi:hypothetical protein UB45_00605 [Terrabacter sp. 28]|nr:hypothetical protein UB45_00605 [Terrabacter sp. 28]
MPDGSAPDPERQAQILQDLSYWPSKRQADGVPKVDIDSYNEAQYVRMLGVPADDPILAWGDVYFGEPRIAPARADASCVVTATCVVAWWRARPLIEGWIGFHEDQTAVDFGSDNVVQLDYSRALHLGQAGNSDMGRTTVFLREKWGADPHRNRRSTSVVVTAAIRGERPLDWS